MRQFPTKPSQPEEINSYRKGNICLGSDSKRRKEPNFQPSYVVWPHDVRKNIYGWVQSFNCGLAGKLEGAGSESLLGFGALGPGGTSSHLHIFMEPGWVRWVSLLLLPPAAARLMEKWGGLKSRGVLYAFEEPGSALLGWLSGVGKPPLTSSEVGTCSFHCDLASASKTKVKSI